MLLLKVPGALLVCTLVTMGRFAEFLAGGAGAVWEHAARAVWSRLTSIAIDMSWPSFSASFSWPSALAFDARITLAISLTTLCLQYALLGWRLMWPWIERWGRDTVFRFERQARGLANSRDKQRCKRCRGTAKESHDDSFTGGTKMHWPTVARESIGKAPLAWATAWAVASVQFVGTVAVVFLQRSMLGAELLLRKCRGGANAEAVANATVRGHLLCNKKARLRVDLTGCTNVTPAVLPCVIEMRQLILERMEIDDEMCQAWATAIAENCPALVELRLGENNIGASGARAMAKMLVVNRSLPSLDLYGNEIGAGGAKAIAAALPQS